MQIDKISRLFELRDIEKTVLEKLFISGDIGATDLSRLSNISRTSVYDILEALKQKGLVLESQIGGVKTFNPEKPEKIQLLIEKKAGEISAALSDLKKIKEFQQKNRAYSPPKMHVASDVKSLQHMMNDMLLYRDETVLSYWPITKVTELLTKEFFAEFHKKRVRENIKVNMIWPNDQSVNSKVAKLWKDEYMEGISVRIAPEGINFSLGYTMYGDTVRFISSKQETYGFLIESKEMSEMMRGQFETIWKISKKI